MQAAWHPDPTGRHELRYWDGTQWTDHVADQGVQSTSPLYPPQDQEQAQEQPQEQPREEQASAQDAAPEEAAEPVREQEEPHDEPVAAEPAPAEAETLAAHDPAPVAEPAPVAAQEPPAQQPAWGAQPPQQAAPAQDGPPPYGGAPAGGFGPGPGYGPGPGGPGGPGPGGPGGMAPGAGGISGELIDGRYAEAQGTGAVLQNKKMLRVRIDQPFMARQGAMVAYQGDVVFNFQGGGAAKFLKKAFTGEGLSLMRVEGRGDVFLADTNSDVHILHLENSGISVSGKNVLAFSGSLDWNIERVKGGSMAAGGLFNTMLRGTGWVAITTDGSPVVLNAAEAPTFADADALVAWSIDLGTSVKSSFTAGALIGRGSGEAFQVAFQGQGFVIVQPSEGAVVPPHSH